MVSPLIYIESETLDARLVTKTSLPNPKKAISLLILLWFANGKPDAVIYGKDVENKSNGGILDESTVNLLTHYANSQGGDISNLSIAEVLSDNPLFTSQMEALNSAFELVWHLASFSFVDSSLNRGAERAGGIRYRKCIKYSTNLDLIDLIGDADQSSLISVLFAWLSEKSVSHSKELEKRLVRALTVFAESSFFKTSKGEKGRVFVPSGIYDALLDNSDSVDIVDPDEEIQGTTRILKPAIASGLNSLLKSEGSKVTFVDSVNLEAVKNYSNRAKAGLCLSNIKVNITAESKDGVSHKEDQAINEPYNLIFFGAPGTGKSYSLQRKAAELFQKDNIRRVTFYPDYTHSQFVGCFKPYTKYETSKDTESVSTEKSCISYEFVPGPFLETYVAAIQNPKKNYLLIIEEINRANAASVFGDILQLLDRNESGKSEYEISVPREIRDFFLLRLPEFATAANIADAEELLSEQIRLDSETGRISLPSNMYMWATMNSADQGVFMMDTAFKRRWDYIYLGINEGESLIKDAEVEIADNDSIETIFWNDLRRSINKLLLEEVGVNEDKLLGPFFISPQLLRGQENFRNIFKSKVLLYLFEDAGRMRRNKLFSKPNTTYSQVCFDFDARGTAIFSDNFEKPKPLNRPENEVKDEPIDIAEG